MDDAIPVVQSREHRLDKSINNVSKQRYISQAWMNREWETVWTKHWQAAAHISDLRESGDYVVYDIGRESILLTCAEDGEIRAFYNVCQHRGLRLVDSHCGHTDTVRCPYHSWRYNMDGALNFAPGEELFQQGLPADKTSLKPVRCEVALGFVWIVLDSDSESLTDYLEHMLPIMSHYQFETMTLTLDQTVSVNCNWKAVQDNFSELYHVPYLHPQHRRFVDCASASNDLYPSGHSRVRVPGGTTDTGFAIPESPTDILSMQLTSLGLSASDYTGRVEDVQAAIRDAKRALGESSLPYYKQFTDEELSDVIQTNVFPNTIFSYSTDMCWLLRMRPHPTDPNQCYLDKLSLEKLDSTVESQHPAPDTEKQDRPIHDSFDYSDVIAGRKTMTDTIDQDLSLLQHAQQGMQSDGFKELWLSEAECRISHFHEQLDRCMDKD
ncbi:MAG: aromatic ring-hydroxylating dioxygenase subunit alpha [Halioglobus sp.]